VASHIKESGERKSATDSQVMSSIKAREKELNLEFKAELCAYEDELEVWQAERNTLVRDRDADKATKRARLAVLGPKPKGPLHPIILLEEPTIEGLAKLLLTGQPSVGVFSAEGGEFVGGHAMKLRLLSINSTGATRQMIARGQFMQYWLHIDAEVAERELAALAAQAARSCSWCFSWPY
jgi:hypothetical protein